MMYIQFKTGIKERTAELEDGLILTKFIKDAFLTGDDQAKAIAKKMVSGHDVDLKANDQQFGRFLALRYTMGLIGSVNYPLIGQVTRDTMPLTVIDLSYRITEGYNNNELAVMGEG